MGDQTRVPQESQDHKESSVENGVHRKQIQEAGTAEAMQTFRAWRREETKGTDDPVLSGYFAIMDNIYISFVVGMVTQFHLLLGTDGNTVPSVAWSRCNKLAYICNISFIC